MWQENQEPSHQPWSAPRPRPSRHLWTRSAAGPATAEALLLPEAEQAYRSGPRGDELLAQRLQQREEAVAAHQLAAAQHAEDQARQAALSQRHPILTAAPWNNELTMS